MYGMQRKYMYLHSQHSKNMDSSKEMKQVAKPTGSIQPKHEEKLEDCLSFWTCSPCQKMNEISYNPLPQHLHITLVERWQYSLTVNA